MESKKANTKARDIKLRLEVIKGKMEDLWKMGSAMWAGGLVLNGDQCMTEVITSDSN